MPANIKLTLGAFVNMTGDAMVTVDPRKGIVRYASHRAIDLIGPVLREKDVPVATVFLNEKGCFDAFIADALTVTEPIISSVSLRADERELIVKGRRFAMQDGTTQVLLFFEAESEFSSRLRLMTEQLEDLKVEVRRRLEAERTLSENISSLKRSVTVVRQISELDVLSGDYLDMAASAIKASFKSHGSAVIYANLGKLRVMASSGALMEAFDEKPYLDLSLEHFQRIPMEQVGKWHDPLVSSLRRASTIHIDFANALVLPLSVAGELRGALICLLDPNAFGSENVRLEGEIISDALGGLLARAEIEERMIHAQKLQAVGELTGGIAHDFNNILAVVLGNAELLLYELDYMDRDVAEEIRQAALRGATLTSRLLSFARKQPLQPEAIDANRLLREFDPLIRRTIREDIHLELVCAGGLWKAQVDKSQLENALLNLVANARDAMPVGGQIIVETSNTWLDQEYAEQHSEVRAGQYVMIAVSDTGHGMSPEIIQEAFTPFFTTKQVGKGSGLGLSMVFGFVKQSLGHVKIYSEPGLGTTVRMYLPRDPSGLPDTDEIRSATNEQASLGKGRILLVEDDMGVLKYLKKSLEMLGYEVEGSLTGEDGAELLKTHVYDLLLTDVVLPGDINGAGLAKIAGQLAPDMPVLFMSGYTENSIVHNGRLDPGVDFISKPFTRDQLAKRLKILINT